MENKQVFNDVHETVAKVHAQAKITLEASQSVAHDISAIPQDLSLEEKDAKIASILRNATKKAKAANVANA